MVNLNTHFCVRQSKLLKGFWTLIVIGLVTAPPLQIKGCQHPGKLPIKTHRNGFNL